MLAGIGRLGVTGANALELASPWVSARAGAGGMNLLLDGPVQVGALSVGVAQVQADGSVAIIDWSNDIGLRTVSNGTIVARTGLGALTIEAGIGGLGVKAGGNGNVLLQGQGSNGNVVLKGRVELDAGNVTVLALNAVVQQLGGDMVVGHLSSGTGSVMVRAGRGRA